MTERIYEEPRRRVPENPPEALEAPSLKRHFEAVRRILLAQFAVCAGFSPTTTGGMREWVVQEFLRQHLPGSLSVGSGHILYEDEASRQQDVIVHLRDSLVLPIGS